jgi:hypothetical protein
MCLRSPEEFMQAAKDMQLDGREPETVDDWNTVMNFVAFNTARGSELAVCRLFKVLYDVPLAEEQLVMIVEFQSMYKE